MCLAASGGSIFIAKAGYMASVFRLSPNTHTLPVKETVTRSHLSWVGDVSGDRRGGHRRRGGHEDLGLGAAHPPGEVAGAGGDAHLARADHAHVVPEAGAAGGVGDDATGVGDVL